ncbi:leucine-rich repeat protein kinase family protein [Actinidia rufa]|uniref:Leucine-rich repeat protein kinase family protein n=1 Tax=Actinidia rufa TaxID=165716 RepID=A0A7J0HAE8_9ERIC|nr:leucine-rich repeat protein kinase family protein [Actinidia rufa]
MARGLSPSRLPPPDGPAPTPCEWIGVTCDSSGYVTSINLASKSLSGELPSELNQLSRLKSLSLQRNRLSGTFPPLTNLTSLQQNFPRKQQFLRRPLAVPRRPHQPPNPKPLRQPQSPAMEAPFNPHRFHNPNLSLRRQFQSIRVHPGHIRILPEPPESPPLIQQSHRVLTRFLRQVRDPKPLAQQPGPWLSGRVDVLSSMSQLTQVWLHKNQFSGPIPDLSACTSLFDLSLRNNELTGPVPNSLTTLPKLANVSLENNKLQGPSPNFHKGVLVSLGNTNNFCNPCDSQITTLLEISGAFGYPMALADSWSGNDPCKGWKSVSCDPNGAVSVINFGKQGWTGTISPAIANLSALTTLLLNDNNLTGSIPPSLTKLAQLKTLDVSNNNISGKVPVFGSGVTVNTSGNPFVGKDMEYGNGSSSGGTTVGGSGSAASKSSVSQWVIGATIVAAVVFFSGFVVGGFTSSDKGYSGFGSELPSQSSAGNSSIQVYDGGNVAILVEVLREVTNNFSEDNILGRGGFGVVYRGQLPDGTQIAVKRMEVTTMASSKGLSEFQAEIAVLSRVRHRHLVALKGFCVDGNERLLVYEYMPQGTLGQHLFRYRELGFPPLTWKQRVTIVLDVARGVEYLHSLAQQSFIHRDLKPSNILLGDDMRAKVSDFGLVRNAPDGKYSVETRLAGTFGYLAPEYSATGKATTKIDVFAFGVVLMEIITGKKALDNTLPDEESYLVSWFRRLLNNKNSIRKSLDPSLDPDEETFASICKVAELAGHCTAPEPLQRPDMGHAVNTLSPLVDQWKPATRDEEDSFGIDLHMSLPQALQKWQSSEDTSSISSSNFHNGYRSNSGFTSSFNLKHPR